MKRAGAEPKWLIKRMVMAIHDEAVEMFGGTAGSRDDGLLESALSRPQNRSAYENEATLFDVAASLCYGICKDRPFRDGNKRTALLAARSLLKSNEFIFEPPEHSEVIMMSHLEAGEVARRELAFWFEKYSRREETDKLGQRLASRRSGS